MSKQEGFTYDPELERGYFIQIRSDFCRSPAFTVYAKVLYEVLLTYAAEKETAWPGQARLAEHLGCTDRMIRKVLRAELIPAGLVSVRRPGQGHPNTYHLHKLQTLPAKSRTERGSGLKRNHTPIKNRPAIRSRPDPRSAEIESDQIQTAEIQGEGSEFTDVDRRVMERTGLSPDEYRALRGR